MGSRTPMVTHPSHKHPLRVYKALAKEKLICSGCQLDLIGASCKCTMPGCNFILHKTCMSLSHEIRHKAHPNHPLTLCHNSNRYKSSFYRCDGCGEFGSNFAYNCSICKYDLHIGCVAMPESVKREEHVHPLKLQYKFPYAKGKRFRCDVCEEIVPSNRWTYLCKECDYGTHVHPCAVEKVVEEEEESEEEEEEESEEEEEEESEEEEEESEEDDEGPKRGGNKRGKRLTKSELSKAQRQMENMEIEVDMEFVRGKMTRKANKANIR